MTLISYYEKTRKRWPQRRYKLIYFSSDESDYSTPNTTPDHHLESIYPDSINQLKASQSDQRPNMGTETVLYPPTPNASMLSGDEEKQSLTPIIGNLEQYTWQRRYHPIQLGQHLQPLPDTLQSPPSEDQGQKDIFRPYDLPNPSTAASKNDLLNVYVDLCIALQNLYR